MNLKIEGRIVFFATTNPNKFFESREAVKKYRITIGMLKCKSFEVQGDEIEEIAEASAKESFKRCNLPLVVEDSGLFIEALKGFPGPYSCYVQKTIGNKGVLRLLGKTGNRKAYFRSVVAYYSESMKTPVSFNGMVNGEITEKESKTGKMGFGFDPIFKPNNSERTFAEMKVSEKNMFSHRAKAFQEFAKWYGRFQ